MEFEVVAETDETEKVIENETWPVKKKETVTETEIVIADEIRQYVDSDRHQDVTEHRIDGAVNEVVVLVDVQDPLLADAQDHRESMNRLVAVATVQAAVAAALIRTEIKIHLIPRFIKKKFQIRNFCSLS